MQSDSCTLSTNQKKVTTVGAKSLAYAKEDFKIILYSPYHPQHSLEKRNVYQERFYANSVNERQELFLKPGVALPYPHVAGNTAEDEYFPFLWVSEGHEESDDV